MRSGGPRAGEAVGGNICRGTWDDTLAGASPEHWHVHVLADSSRTCMLQLHTSQLKRLTSLSSAILLPSWPSPSTWAGLSLACTPRFFSRLPSSLAAGFGNPRDVHRDFITPLNAIDILISRFVSVFLFLPDHQLLSPPKPSSPSPTRQTNARSHTPPALKARLPLMN